MAISKGIDPTAVHHVSALEMLGQGEDNFCTLGDGDVGPCG